MCTNGRRQHGITLIELLMFIVIIGVGMAGVLNAYKLTLIHSTDPVIIKQQIAIAESLMDEIQSKPFTFCDPDDANVETATSAAACASLSQGLGATAGESRYTFPYFDNVGDYHGFSMDGIKNPNDGTAITGLTEYKARVTITEVGTTSPTNVADAAAVLKIVVDVAARGQEFTDVPPTFFSLTAYRYRYAPNSP